MNYYETIAQLTAAKPSGQVLAFCEETNLIYRYESSDSVTANSWSILTTGNGGNTRWVSLFYNEINIDSTGKVGINTTGADKRFEILDTVTQFRLTYADGSKFVDFTVDTNHDLLIQPSSTGQIKLQPTTDSTDFFQVLDADGGTPILNVDSTNERVGIGTTSPGAKLEINDAIAPKMRFGRSSSYYWDIGHTSSDFQIQSQTGGTIMHLNYDGNVGVGTTSPSEKLQVNGTVRATSYKSSDGSAGVTSTFTVRNGNNSASLTFVIKNGIVTSVSSDRRLKENITLIGTSDSGINIYTYEYKYKFSLAGVGLFQGVMSDEVPAEAVSVDEHGYDMVDYSLIDVEFKKLSN